MEKITLQYEYSGEYGKPRKCIIEFDNEGMSFDEFLEELKRFSLVVGYMPDTVKAAFPEE